MSNPQIIIRNGRIDAAVSNNGMKMIRAASQAATDLVVYYGDRLTLAETQPISDLQHEMMDLLNTKPVVKDAGEMVDEMFGLLEALEKKMEQVSK